MTIEDLEKICESATPGPWDWCYDSSSDWSVGPKEDPQGKQIASCWRPRASNNPDAEYIAKFNPDLVSKLLGVVKAAKYVFDHKAFSCDCGAEEEMDLLKEALKRLEK